MITQITKQIAIGDIYDAVNEDALKQLKIGVILNVNNIDSGEERKLVALKLGLSYFYAGIPIEGQSPEKNKKDIEGAVTLLEFLCSTHPLKRILVHCGGGLERSPLVVALYLAKVAQLTLPQAYDIVKQQRPQIIKHYEWAP